MSHRTNKYMLKSAVETPGEDGEYVQSLHKYTRMTSSTSL